MEAETLPGQVGEEVREANIESEEGEIVSDKGWITVSPTSVRKSNQQSQLVYGQFRIASPTRFEVLKDLDREENGDHIGDIPSSELPFVHATEITNTLIVNVDAANVLQSQSMDHVEHLGTAGSVLRVSIPRSSKQPPKLVSNTYQRAKPSGVGKRNKKTIC